MFFVHGSPRAQQGGTTPARKKHIARAAGAKPPRWTGFDNLGTLWAGCTPCIPKRDNRSTSTSSDIWCGNALGNAAIRALAKDIGLDKSTVHNFINGSAPHARIQRVLYEWYSREVPYDGAMPTAVTDALAVLVANLPPMYDDIGRRVVLGALAGVHRAAGLDPPPWTRDGT